MNMTMKHTVIGICVALTSSVAMADTALEQLAHDAGVDAALPKREAIQEVPIGRFEGTKKYRRLKENVICVDREIQDATLSAQFWGIGSKAVEVDLFVPAGGEMTSGETYSGQCTPDEGAIELSLICNVFTSTDSGYTVRLFSLGAPELKASATPWSMAGQGNVTILPCYDN